MEKERIILGIDPGTQLLGFGIIRAEGKKASYVDMGVLDLRKEKDAYVKLQAIYDCMTASPRCARAIIPRSWPSRVLSTERTPR